MEMVGALNVISILISTITALVATFIAYRSLKITATQLNEERLDKALDVHFRFHDIMEEIRKVLPSRDRMIDPKWQPSEAEDKAMYRYWYLTFHEWFVSENGGTQVKKFWEKMYKNGIKRALSNPALKLKLEKMFDGEASFLGFRDEFFRMMNKLCLEVNNESLRVKNNEKIV